MYDLFLFVNKLLPMVVVSAIAARQLTISRGAGTLLAPSSATNTIRLVRDAWHIDSYHVIGKVGTRGRWRMLPW